MFSKGSVVIALLMSTWIAGFTQQVSKVKAHSHNDYEQLSPFELAFNAGFESIEADVYLRNGKLLVGHEPGKLDSLRTLESLYLSRMTMAIRSGRWHRLQLLIDVKTEALSTLDSIVSVLARYPLLTGRQDILFVISGNRPAVDAYPGYPRYIWFDGRPYEHHTKEQLSKVALISDAFPRYLKEGVVDSGYAMEAVNKAHALGKPFRFWASPDHQDGWNLMIRFGVNFLNTDRIEAMAEFLANRFSVQ